MQMVLKPLSEQVIVLTGATSRTGRLIAEKAARHGATLVVAGQDDMALQELALTLQQAGCKAALGVAIGTGKSELERLAGVAVERFGGFDTWISNLDTILHGMARSSDTQAVDLDEYCQTMLDGARVARDRLAGRQGTVITVAVPDTTLSAHDIDAVRLLDCIGIHCCRLRNELSDAAGSVGMTLIRPAPADDGFQEVTSHKTGQNAADEALQNCPREAIAAASLRAAQFPTREIYVGGVFSDGPVPIHYTPCRQEMDALHRVASKVKKSRDDQTSR